MLSKMVLKMRFDSARLKSCVSATVLTMSAVVKVLTGSLGSSCWTGAVDQNEAVDVTALLLLLLEATAAEMRGAIDRTAVCRD